MYESEVNCRKRVFCPLGRLTMLGGGWYWRSPLMEKASRVCSIVSRKEVVSSLERLISRLWIVGLSRTWMVAILGFGRCSSRALKRVDIGN